VTYEPEQIHPTVEPASSSRSPTGQAAHHTRRQVATTRSRDMPVPPPSMAQPADPPAPGGNRVSRPAPPDDSFDRLPPMQHPASAAAKDRWAEWLLSRRDGGDRTVQERQLPKLRELRDRVLANADIREGDVLLDVGAGNGLVGFGALDQIGASGRVILSDISESLLEECRRIAAELGASDRCDFLHASADDLHALADESVDIITTRSVLIYLNNKRPAFDEFMRVLKPGGRLSIFEPINRFGHPRPPHLLLGYDVSSVQDLAAKIRAQLAQHLTDQHPLLNFDERDLLKFALEAGFCPVRADYSAHVRVDNAPVTNNWDTFKSMSGNPLAPTLEEVMEAALSPAEKRSLEQHLRPLVENGAGRRLWSASVYLSAGKPSSSP
jgi:arsenite methyltransferase